jgi:ESX secretion-associated protein EspJ
MTGGIGDHLRVDTELLGRLGSDLQASAGDLPTAPPPFVVSGEDPISLAIAGRLPGIEGPIQEALPQLKAEATKTASNIVTAAGMYQNTDEQFAANYEKHQFDQASATGAGGGGSGDGGGDSMGQMSQLMSMPMQMASQAAQIPMQAMSAVTSLPQTVMQGVQQIGQMTGGMGKSDGSSDGQPGQPGGPGMDQPQDRHDEDKPKQDHQDGAAPGDTKGERAPDSKPSEAPHTPTPAEPPVPQQSSPRHAAPDPTVNL